MKRLVLCAILGALSTAPAMFADVVDYMLNVNGTTYCPSYSGATCSNMGGLAAAGATGTLDTSFGGTGLGTVNLTFNPGAPGTYNVNFLVFEELFPATGQNEYGASNGSPASGQSWQIDTPDYDYVSGFDPNFGGLPAGAATIFANTASNTLANTNYIPGTLPQDTFSCSSSPNCNDYTAMALGYNFTLAAGDEEVLSFNVSTTPPPSGLYLEQIAPVDGANPNETDYFFSATANTVSVCSGPNCNAVPEPSSMIPLFGFVGVLWLVVRRRSAAV